MKRKEVIVHGHKMAYVESGKGKPVLLVHGWADKALTFHNLIASLENDFKLYALDLPGFGSSEMWSESMGLSEFADAVQRFVDKVVDEEVYAVIGHSNGGAISIKALGQEKLKAEKLILLASSGVRIKRKGSALYRLTAKMLRPLFSLLPHKLSERAKKRLYSTIGSDYFVAGHMKESFKKIVAEDIRSDASQVQQDCLLIYGSDDKATPPEFGREIESSLAGTAKFVQLDGAPHMLHHTDAEIVQQTIKQFLNGQS